MILFLCFILLLTYLAVNLILVAIRNREAHQFFKLRAPNLPVAPNLGLFAGHLSQPFGLKSKNWKAIHELHKKYGRSFGIYWAEKPFVLTTDIDLLKFIEVDEGHKHVNRFESGLPVERIEKSIFQSRDDNWRRIRRSVAPAFTNRKVRGDEVSLDIENVLDQLSASLKHKVDKAEMESGERSVVVDLTDTFKRYTLAVIFLIVYKQANVIDFNAEKDQWIEDFIASEKALEHPLGPLSIMFPFLRPIATFIGRYHRVGQMHQRIVDFITQAIDTKPDSSKGSGRRRFVDTLIEAHHEKKLEYDELLSTLEFLLLAGFETTADTITCLIWQLARNPEIQEKMRKVIIEEGMDAEYVMWCINETLRWHPAVPLGVGRILADDVCLNGTFIPKGAYVSPSIYSIHHDPSIWPEHEKYNPERWKDAASFHPAAFMGFGLGPRNCIGGKLAVHEIKLVMRFLLTTYRIEICEETCDTYEFSTPALLFTIANQPVKVRLVALSRQYSRVSSPV